MYLKLLTQPAKLCTYLMMPRIHVPTGFVDQVLREYALLVIFSTMGKVVIFEDNNNLSFNGLFFSCKQNPKLVMHTQYWYVPIRKS